jgi:hypothetical protein
LTSSFFFTAKSHKSLGNSMPLEGRMKSLELELNRIEVNPHSFCLQGSWGYSGMLRNATCFIEPDDVADMATGNRLDGRGTAVRVPVDAR